MGRVVGVYLAGAGGLAMRSVQAAVAVASQGLLGDRYQAGTGAEHGVHLQGGAARRNVETCGVDLQALVGRQFQIGEVVLYGNRPCEPCRYLDRVTGQPPRPHCADEEGCEPV